MFTIFLIFVLAVSSANALVIEQPARRAAALTWSLVGCVVDGPARALSAYNFSSNSLTPKSCIAGCSAAGYSYAGVEYYSQCFCANAFTAGFGQVVDSSQCNTPCSGASSQSCGGTWRLDVYKSSAASSTTSKSNTLSMASTLSSASTLFTSSARSTTVTSTTLSVVPSVVSVSSAVTSTSISISTSTSTTTSSIVTSTTTTASTSTTTSTDKLVVAHFIVGNTYPYTQADWLSDIQLAASKGIDGFSLNVGSDTWESARIADAYAAASTFGNTFKLFFSFDMSSLSCSSTSDAAAIRNYINTYATHPAQLYFRGRPLVSTFSGESCTFGADSVNDGWISAVRSGVPSVYFIPSFFVDPSTLSSYSVLDGDFDWNGSWPESDVATNFNLDNSHIAGNSGRFFMAAASPWFFAHYSFKNWFYGGDDWLFAARWEQLLSNRARVDIVQIISWNDYGESHYVGPIEGAQPNSQAWVDGFDHTPWLDLGKVYAQAFKTGVFPTLSNDQVFMWSRPHPANATASSDSLGKPTGYNWTSDYLWAVVFNTAPANITLTSGANTQTFAVSAGVAKLQLSSAPGSIRATLTRSGKTVVDVAPSAFTYTATPTAYNYNAFVASGSS